MRLSPAQLDTLSPDRLPRVVAVFGPEPLLRREAEDRVRALARAAGADERALHSVTTGFDWSELTSAGQTLSLFASRRLVEIHSETAAWGKAGGDALRALVADTENPDFLLIRFGAIEARQYKSAWFRALEASAALVETRPVSLEALPGWLVGRASALGLVLSPEAADLVAERVEGNLLAAQQELEKLALLHPGGRIDATTILTQTTDSARFDIFRLVDAALEGDAARAQRILAALRVEGVEPVLMVWAFDRELHRVAYLHEQAAMGNGAAGCWQTLAVFNDQQRRRLTALQRRISPGRARHLLEACRRLDRIVKGADPSWRLRDPWLALAWLTAAVASPSVTIGAAEGAF